MSTRAIVVGIVIVAAALMFLVGRMLYPPAPEPTPTPAPTVTSTPTPEPFEPPEPEDEDLELPTLAKIPVCCCENRYGDCINARMVREAARLHAIKHSHDLIGSACVSVAEEDLALGRALRRPEKVEKNGRNALAMADRAAHRERLAGGR